MTSWPGSHVDPEELPALEDTYLPSAYIDIEIPLLALGGGIITDRHHASANNYEPSDVMNQIGGQITGFTWAGWFRYGAERVRLRSGVIICHPGAANGDYVCKDVYERDLENGTTNRAVVPMRAKSRRTPAGSPRLTSKREFDSSVHCINEHSRLATHYMT